MREVKPEKRCATRLLVAKLQNNSKLIHRVEECDAEPYIGREGHRHEQGGGSRSSCQGEDRGIWGFPGARFQPNALGLAVDLGRTLSGKVFW